ncbi:hypothetical protein V4Y02_23375, partial [Escherichia coli]
MQSESTKIMLCAYINIPQGISALCISKKKQSNINKQRSERKFRRIGGGEVGQNGREGIINSTEIPCMYDFVKMNPSTMHDYKFQIIFLKYLFSCKQIFYLFILFIYFYVMLRIEPSASHMRGKCSTTELHTAPALKAFL